MIGKQQIMAEELRGQAAEHLPPVVRMMAEAVTGGDIKALNKMMERGELDPSKHLPLLFKAMRENAQPFMDQYFKTITFWQGKAQKNQEDWVKRFLNSGGTDAIAGFYKTWSQVIGDSIPAAETLGRIFKSAAHYLNAALLVPGEVLSWLKGTPGQGNFMTAILGDPNQSDFAQSIKRLFDEVTKAFVEAMNSMTLSTRQLSDLVITTANILGAIIGKIADIVSLLNAYDKGGASMVAWQHRTNANMSQAKDLARQQVGPGGTQADIDAATKQNFDFLQASNPMPQGSTSMNPGQWGANLATWSAGVDAEVQSLEGGRGNLLNWVQAYTGLGNRPVAVPENMPTSAGGSTSVIRIMQDPIQLNAVVEARSDEEAIQNMMNNFFDRRESMIFGNIISNNPMVTQ